MNNAISENYELFLKNAERMKHAFSWSHPELNPLCASLYTAKGREVDSSKIKSCKKMIKEYTSPFSRFRGSSLLVFATMLSVEEEPSLMMKEALSAYRALKEVFPSTKKSPFIALSVVSMAKTSDYTSIAAKAKEIYRGMKRTHPFLTSHDDYFYAVLLALQDMSVDQLIFRIEQAHCALRKSFNSSNALQTTSHVLAMGNGDVEYYASNVSAIYQLMRQEGLSCRPGMQMASIGTLALLEEEPEKMATQLVEIHDKLKKEKGFGSFSMDKTQRIMYAVTLLSSSYTEDTIHQNVNSGLANNRILNTILAQHTAIMAAVVVTTTVNSTSSSN